MSEEPTPSSPGCAVASLHWLGFLLLFPASTCVVTLATGGAIAALLGSGAAGVEDVLDPETLMGPGLVGATATLQIAMMALGAMALSVLLPPRASSEPAITVTLAHVADSFAVRRASAPWWIAGVLGCLTIGMLPGWFASRLMEVEALKGFSDGMMMVSTLLERTSDPGWVVLAFAVVISAPICEELIFRGFLWRAAGHGLPQVGVWLATSVLFAAYHLNPIHVVAVLPIGLFLGWLRWWSGSIWPGMAGHFANNALALAATVFVGAEAEVSLPLSTLGFGFAMVCAAAPVAWARRTQLEAT